MHGSRVQVLHFGLGICLQVRQKRLVSHTIEQDELVLCNECILYSYGPSLRRNWNRSADCHIPAQKDTFLIAIKRIQV